MKYYELRYYNTLNCIKLTEKLILRLSEIDQIKITKFKEGITLQCPHL